MMIRTILSASILAVLPLAGIACTMHKQQASSCAEGYVWDAAAHACVQQVSG